MGRAELFPAGRGGAGHRWKSAWRGAGENPQGRGEKAHKSTDPKIWQKCVNCYWDICSALWCFDKGKHYILSLLKGISLNKIVTFCPQISSKHDKIQFPFNLPSKAQWSVTFNYTVWPPNLARCGGESSEWTNDATIEEACKKCASVEQDIDEKHIRNCPWHFAE